MASKHLSIRMEPESLARLDRESLRMRLSRSEVARTLLEEGLRMEAHPGIVFKPGPAGRRPAVIAGPDVWEIIGGFPDRRVAEEGIAFVAQIAALSERQVRDAVRYYLEFQDEIDAWIKSNDEEAERAYAEWLRHQTLLK